MYFYAASGNLNVKMFKVPFLCSQKITLTCLELVVLGHNKMPVKCYSFDVERNLFKSKVKFFVENSTKAP